MERKTMKHKMSNKTAIIQLNTSMLALLQCNLKVSRRRASRSRLWSRGL